MALPWRSRAALMVGALAAAVVCSGMGYVVAERFSTYVPDGNISARPYWQVLLFLAVGVAAALLLMAVVAAVLAPPVGRARVVGRALVSLLAGGSAALVTGVGTAALTGFRNDVSVRATVVLACCVVFVLVTSLTLRHLRLPSGPMG